MFHSVHLNGVLSYLSLCLWCICKWAFVLWQHAYSVYVNWFCPLRQYAYSVYVNWFCPLTVCIQCVCELVLSSLTVCMWIGFVLWQYAYSVYVNWFCPLTVCIVCMSFCPSWQYGHSILLCIWIFVLFDSMVTIYMWMGFCQFWLIHKFVTATV